MAVSWPALLSDISRQGVLVILLATAAAAHGQSVTGSVADAYSNRPLDGATVVLVGTLYAAVTDARGGFAIRMVQPGMHELQVILHGYHTFRQQITVVPGREVSLSIRLAPTSEDLTVSPVVVRSLQLRGGRQGLRRMLQHVPAVQPARRTLYDFTPSIRGLHSAQVAVRVDGTRSAAGSPLGAPLRSISLPSEIEVVTGPYALTWGGEALSGVAVRTPLVDAVSAAVAYVGAPQSIDVAGIAGRVRTAAAYEVAGSYGTSRGYSDSKGMKPFADMRATALRGRARFARAGAAFAAWTGYQARGTRMRDGISQIDAGIQFSRRFHHRSVRRVDVATAWQRRSVSGWPAPDTGDFSESRADGYAHLHLAPLAGWGLMAGTDLTQVRYRRKQLGHAGIFVWGSKEVGGLQITAAVRGHGVQSAEAAIQPRLSAALAVRRALGTNLQLSASAGTASRPASVFERYAASLPYVRMPFAITAEGNPALKPERIYQTDLAVQRSWLHTAVSLEVFVRHIRDQIAVVDVPAYGNVDVTHAGGELSIASSTAGDLVRTLISIAVVHGGRSPAAGVAPASAAAAVVLQAPGALFLLEADLRAAVPCRGTLLETQYRVPGYAVLDFHLGIPLPHQLQFKIGIRNALNTRYGLHASGLRHGSRLLEEPGRQWFILLQRAL